MKNIHLEETYEGRNVLSQYDRPDFSRSTNLFFLLCKRVYQKKIFLVIYICNPLTLYYSHIWLLSMMIVKD